MAGFEDFARVERDGWSDPGTARSYADVFAEASRLCVPATVAAVGAAPGCRALDLCCGPGVITGALVGTGAQVTGLDFSPSMLDIARDAVPTARFVEGDAAATPFEDGSFDAVTIGFGIPHVPDPEAVFREVHRILAPGGRFAFSVWLGPQDSLTFRTVFGNIVAHGAPGISLPPGPDANTYAYAEAAYPALRAAGFSDFARVEVEAGWLSDRADAPFHIFEGGTVRGGSILRRQPARNLEAIRAAIEEDVIAELGPTGPWRIPIPAAVISATA